MDKSEALEYLKLPKEKLYESAHKITLEHIGTQFSSCSIINAKSGNCPEDCKWCAQSIHNKTQVNKYPLLEKDEAVKWAARNMEQGISRFSIVTSGKRVSDAEVDKICEIVREITKLKGKGKVKKVLPCVSLGLVNEQQLKKLKEAGVTRYHCNIESSPAYFKNLCTTHTTNDKLETLKAARRVGMTLCSGGIIGMGESMEDRIDMALFLREHGIKSIPINVLHPIPGTPLEHCKPLSEEEYLTTVAMFRIINPDAFLRFSGGRALLTKEVQKKALYIGINAAIMGDMLTTLGSGVANDIQMFTEAGYDFYNEKHNSLNNEEENFNIQGSPIEKHIWHPYSSTTKPTPTYFVERAKGAKITIRNPETGAEKELIDGMSSWWAEIHGYNNSYLNNAARKQLAKMSHVMFGGFTHEAVQHLTEQLLQILPKELDTIFYADSGSVSVEVAMKMAVQYWASMGMGRKSKFATIRSGYHGDTWNAMSVCDPVTGMHSLFGPALPVNYFAPSPAVTYSNFEEYMANPGASQDYFERVSADIAPMEKILKEHGEEIAALILEPVVQGAGGMHFYTPHYLVRLKELCSRYNVLLIFDEIATGFGRTGKLFAYEHTKGLSSNGISEEKEGYVVPDIMTIGKGLTGGYMTMAATICNKKVSETICNNYPGAFMHGPTFMANPLACAVASASVELLQKEGWKERVEKIGKLLEKHLSPARKFNNVADVRVLGSIGVIEMKEAVDLTTLQPQFVKEGIWLRPFGKLVYTMPPYIISEKDLAKLCRGILKVIKNYK